MNEFEIIQHYLFRKDKAYNADVILGIGDDAAVVEVPADHHLVVCMDTLVCDVHFPASTLPADIAYKALAVNISDMAAMGAVPRWATLSLTVPDNDESWFEAFAKGFHELADKHQLQLVGGDMSRGPLSVTVQLQGTVPINNDGKPGYLCRSGAGVGDIVYVTGKLGAAACALKQLLQADTGIVATKEEMLRLNRPEARLRAGLALRDKATSCIDISDGLFADLTHILQASGVGSEIHVEQLPLSETLLSMQKRDAFELALTGGDDYELCFTMPAKTSAQIIKELEQICSITRIGVINNSLGVLTLVDNKGNAVPLSATGYRHF